MQYDVRPESFGVSVVVSKANDMHCLSANPVIVLWAAAICLLTTTITRTILAMELYICCGQMKSNVR